MDATSRNDEPKRRRRAVGPPGARPPMDEPDPEPREHQAPVADDDERFLADRPPHHMDRS